jgi:excinuclease UvrABC helicase subunit UvrB
VESKPDSVNFTVAFPDPRKKLTVSLERRLHEFRISELVMDDNGNVESKTSEHLDVISYRLPIQSNLSPAVVKSIIGELREMRSQYLGEQLQRGSKEDKAVFRRLVKLRRQVLGHCRKLKKGVFFKEQRDYHWHVQMAQASGSRNSLINYMNHFYDGKFLTVWDESHLMKRQVAAMSKGDTKRKDVFVKKLFKLPSFAKPLPLSFEETMAHIEKLLLMTATPGIFEDEHRTEEAVSMVIRPTFIPDPIVELRNRDYSGIRKDVVETREAGMQSLIFGVTRGQLEVVRDLLCKGVRSELIHCGLPQKQRADIMERFRNKELEVLLSIKLNQVGFDVPNVGLVCVLEADGKGSRSGFSRQAADLEQMIGRACRNPESRVLFFAADHSNLQIQKAISQTNERREKQLQYNKENGTTPKAVKRLRDGWWKQPGIEEDDDSTVEERFPCARLAKEHDLKSLLKEYGLSRTNLADFYALLRCHEINFILAKSLLDKFGTLKNVLKHAKNGPLDIEDIGESRRWSILNSYPHIRSKEQVPEPKMTAREKEAEQKQWAQRLDDEKRMFEDTTDDERKLDLLRKAQMRTPYHDSKRFHLHQDFNLCFLR